MAEEQSTPVIPNEEDRAPAVDAEQGGGLEQGTYEIIRARLENQAAELVKKAQELNKSRLETFGGTEMAVIGNERIRTENNCVPRDIAQAGEHLLFGYNVFIGMKKHTSVSDVFTAVRFNEEADGKFSFDQVDAQFLEDETFRKEFGELYEYYKSARLLQLRNLDSQILAVFQTGATVHDFKVLRWQVDRNEITYRDNRGERDHVFAESHDFEWTMTTREDHVQGSHPHVDILGKVFVETVGGDLTVKIEDNTEDGLGIYGEPVDDGDQALDDAEIHYAELGSLILIKVLPYHEETWRYLVFNTRTNQVDRIDAIGLACRQLPEDHGVIFPGGYYLQSGETKSFDEKTDDLEFVKPVRSPNGEDVLYIFHHREDGTSLLLPYNMIRKQVDTIIRCNGYSIFPSGRMVIFRKTSDDPTRVHAMQIWQTPFMTEEFAADQSSESADSFLEKVGNADLVRGVSDAFSLHRSVEVQRPTAGIYNDLIDSATRMVDAYYWLGNEEVGDLKSVVEQIKETAGLVLDEFEKVEALQKQADAALDRAEERVVELERTITPRSWSKAHEFVQKLTELRTERGHLITMRDMRYVDLEKIETLEARLVEDFDKLSTETVEFMRGEASLKPYHENLDKIEGQIDDVEKVADTEPLRENLKEMDEGLQLLSQVVTDLKIDDATIRTELLEGISEVLAGINRTRALLENKRQGLRSTEAVAEFGAEFKLFSQAVTAQLNLNNTPEDCDSSLARLMVQLEDLEARYTDFDDFMAELTTKREEVYEAFSSKKQLLLDQRQRRAQQMIDSASRILENVGRRSQSFGTQDELNAYFASDPMVAKVRDLSERLRDLGDSVKADELDSAVKSARQEATRGLRDRQDIYEDGKEVLKLGRHRFSVNTQPLDLTLVPRTEDGAVNMYVHLTGTDFYERVKDEEFAATSRYWPQALISETGEVARAEYLAASILQDAEDGLNGLSLDELHKLGAEGPQGLTETIRRVASERYDEGYERGVHDADAALLLHSLLSLHSVAELLRFPATERTVAGLYWAYGLERDDAETLQRRAQSLKRLEIAFGRTRGHDELIDELKVASARFLETQELSYPQANLEQAASYLYEELGRDPLAFVTSSDAIDLRDGFLRHLSSSGQDRDFQEDVRKLDNLGHQLQLVRSWLSGFLATVQDKDNQEHWPKALEEAAALLVTDRKLTRRDNRAKTHTRVSGLLSQHRRIENGRLDLRLDEFLSRLDIFRRHQVPGFRGYQKRRHELLERERYRLRISEYMPRVMSSFVRNQLIDQVYLPMIGDNLAKQMGALGDSKRTDLMGLLLLISPPGYGKTTLMEYIASRLGLVFMKINGPALGHSVTSLDPTEAPNATARQEVEKINLSFEMGNNVLLYIDDIQHTSSEFLQKFISLCDGQRRVEGVWNGRTRTYDLRGKKFVVCMAGNPYTESGEKFQIPDMLANRADTYNLGDILDGKDDLFALSYIENALTSNRVLAPVAGRDPKDVGTLVRMARGEAVQADQLSHPYSGVELGEIQAILQKLLRVQEVLLAVNQAYIYSASQDDNFRTEPRFQLQGSYRNMNKLAEKIVPVMNALELESLIDDHYQGESQTLTTGAEANQLKLRELRGVLSEKEQARWDQIKRDFMRMRAMGGSDDDPVTRVTGTLGLVSDRLSEIGSTIAQVSQQALESSGDKAETSAPPAIEIDFGPYLDKLQANLDAISEARAAVPAQTTAPAATTSLDPEAVEAIGRQLGGLSSGLDQICKTIAEVASAVPKTPAAGGSGQRVQVVQTLQPGVHELLEDMAKTIDQQLMEALRAVGRWIQRSGLEPDQRIEALFDRTLAGFDRLKDLLQALQRIDTTSLLGQQAPAPSAAPTKNGPPPDKTQAPPKTTRPAKSRPKIPPNRTQVIPAAKRSPKGTPPIPSKPKK